MIDSKESIRSSSKSKAIVSAASLVVAIGFTWQATSLPLGSLDRPGPGLFPVVTGTFFIFICCVAVVEEQIERYKSLRGERSSPSESSASDAEELDEINDVESAPGTRKMITFLAILTAYIALFVPLGFFVSTILSMIAISTLISGFSRKNIIRNVIFAIALTFVLYFIFAMTLEIRLPAGIYAPTVQ